MGGGEESKQHNPRNKSSFGASFIDRHPRSVPLPVQALRAFHARLRQNQPNRSRFFVCRWRPPPPRPPFPERSLPKARGGGAASPRPAVHRRFPGQRPPISSPDPQTHLGSLGVSGVGRHSSRLPLTQLSTHTQRGPHESDLVHLYA